MAYDHWTIAALMALAVYFLWRLESVMRGIFHKLDEMKTLNGYMFEERQKKDNEIILSLVKIGTKLYTLVGLTRTIAPKSEGEDSPP
jgi:hypothetical protein